MSPGEIARRLGRHTEITGGGLAKWAPGQGTDDSDMAMAVVRAYVTGYSLERVAEGFLAWYRGRPKDIGGTTAAALSLLEKGVSPRKTGRDDELSAANGGLMRCVVTGLVRPAEVRRQKAQEISAITHSERRCLQAVTAHCDLANHLVEGASPAEALGWALDETPLDDDIVGVLEWARDAAAGDLDTSGYVLGTLGRRRLGAVLGPRARGSLDHGCESRGRCPCDGGGGGWSTGGALRRRRRAGALGTSPRLWA